MSGGYFQYQQYKFEDIINAIKDIINANSDPTKYDYAHDYSFETLLKFQETIEHLTKTAKMIHRIDRLVSADDSEETFNKKWDKEI